MENDNREIVDEDFEISEDIETLAKEAKLDSLKKKSLEKYHTMFEIFKTWQKSKKTSLLCEKTLLAYFNEQLMNYKPWTLWSQYSIIRTMIEMNHAMTLSLI